tara:strand:- start:631 stop:1251 length:621 start_codon:yes stop_codon:yes gene_type:complete
MRDGQDQGKKDKKRLSFGFNAWLIPAVISGAATAVAIGFYFATLNLMLIFAILPGVAGLFLSWYKMTAKAGAEASKGISESGPATGNKINAMVIYGIIKDEKHFAKEVKFEELAKEKVLGDRWYFEDVGKWLYVLFNDIKNEETLVAFELPDAQYTDPARLAIPLNMGRVNELFQADANLFDQLKPWILVAVIAIVGFLIFLSGSP